MARVSLIITARDETARAFRAINARATRLGRSFAVGDGNTLGQKIMRGLRGVDSRVRSLFSGGLRAVPGRVSGALRAGLTALPGHLRSGFMRGLRGVGPLMGRTVMRGLRGVGPALGGIFRGAFAVISRVAKGVVGVIMAPVRAGFITSIKKMGAALGPVLVAVLLPVIAGVIALVGAALGGALVFAFGLAFVGLAGFIASKAPAVKKAWSGMVEDVKIAWSDAGKAMEPVVTHGIGLLRKLSDSFVPHFKEAMRGASSPMQDFLDKFAEAIKVFGKKAFHPLMEGFSVLLEALGPEFVSLFGSMGDSFAALGNTVKTHSGEIALAMGIVLRAIGAIIDIVNFLAQMWVGTLRVITAGFGDLIVFGIRPLFDAIMFLATNALHGFALTFGWIPGIGGKIKKADKAFTDWSRHTSEALNRMGNRARDWGKNMDKANKKRELKVAIGRWTKDLAAARKDLKGTLSAKAVKELRMQIKQWTDKLAQARKDLKKTTSTKAKAKLEGTITDLEAKIRRARKLLYDQSHRKSKSKIQGDIRQLESQIAKARRDLNNLNGKTVSTYIKSYHIDAKQGPLYHGNRRTGGIVGMAHGGISRATSSIRDIMVGEAGPEMVRLPPGSQVRTAGGTRGVLHGQQGRLVSNLILKSSGRRTDDMLIEILREAIHQRGGDPVRVLGG